MPRRYRSDMLVLATYFAMTLVLTYPLVLQMGTAVKDLGDPLLNAWIIWWDVEQVIEGNFAGFFDANIFYPHTRSLAFSEMLIPQAIVAAPVLLASGNPILAYNFVLVLAIATSAFAVFLLGRYLTRSDFAGFIAGIAFGFSPYLFDHLSHVQVLTAAGIPLAFLFLHKYFDTDSTKYLLLFSLTFVAQALANGYYAVFLTYFAGLFILCQAYRKQWLLRPRFWGHMALHGLIAVFLLAPFFYQFIALRDELGFVRRITYRGTAWSHLSASNFNKLYGGLTADLSGGEWHLFAGFVTIGLGALGVLSAVYRRHPEAGQNALASERSGPVATFFYRAAGWTVIVCLLVVALISAIGGLEWQFWGISISATRVSRPVILLAAALAVRAVLAAVLGDRVRAGKRALREPQRIYVWMLTLAIILTLGPSGLYGLFHDYAPGFDALRGPARIHVMSIFCLAVLAAFGTKTLLSRMSTRGAAVAIVLVPTLLCFEQLSAPVPMSIAPREDRLPAAYRWLAEQEGEFAIVEYPMGTRSEYRRLYYSIFHSKLLVNGYSGYLSPVFRELRRRSAGFPVEELVHDNEMLGVRYLLMDRDLLRLEASDTDRVLGELEELRSLNRIRLAGDFGSTIVYELTGRAKRNRESFRTWPGPEGELVDRSDWRVTASEFDDLARLALDGDIETRWKSHLQSPGVYFEVDLGEVMEFDAVVLDLGGRVREHPRGYRMETSDDGEEWTAIALDPAYRLPITEFLRPTRKKVQVEVPGSKGRYLRVAQTGESPRYAWSITELNLLRR